MNFAIVELIDKNIEEVQTVFNVSRNKSTTVSAEINGQNYNATLTTSLNGVEGFQLNEVEQIVIEGNELKLLALNIYSERAKKANNWLDENSRLKENNLLVNQLQADFIFFELNNRLYAAGTAGINRVKALLKDAFNYQGEDVCTQLYGINDDFLYWIFKSYIDTPNESLSINESLIIGSLESYVAKTRDNVNAMRGEGDGISVILSTLAFLFNDEELKSIRPTIQYGNEKLLIEIGLTGTYKLWDNTYRGRNFRSLAGKRKELILCVYVHLIVIPILIQSYNEHKEAGTWSNQLKIDFIKRLGERITRQVNQVLQKIENSNPSTSLQQEERLEEPRELIDDEDIIPDFLEESLEEEISSK